MKYLAFALLFLSTSALAESAQECAKLVRTADRLACFDKLFPTETTKIIKSETVQTKPTSNQSTKSQQKETMVGMNNSKASSTTNGTSFDDSERGSMESEKSDGKGFSLGSIFNRNPKADFTSQIKELKSGNSQKMVFLLENGEIWLQNSPRTLPFKVGDTVKLKNGLFGGYVMHSESGTSTRVQRIR